jgi:hypothetical protein
MNVIERLVQTKTFKKFLSRLYGLGASVVVIGALFKIEHWPGASIMLSTGLFTEALIFFFFAFDSEPEPEHPEGEEVQAAGMGYATGGLAVAGVGYAGGAIQGQGAGNLQAAGMGSVPVVYGEGRPLFGGGQQNGREGCGYEGSYGSGYNGGYGGGNQAENPAGSTIALARLDEMLQRADISPDLLMQFGSGLRKLGETVSNLETVGNVTEASQHYVSTILTADESLGKLAKTYEDTISKITSNTIIKYKGIAGSMSVIESEARTYQQQMETLNKLLGTLNTVYSQQRREEDNYLRELVFSAVESKKYRKQVTELNDHLSKLNRYYGGMVNKLEKGS